MNWILFALVHWRPTSSTTDGWTDRLMRGRTDEQTKELTDWCKLDYIFKTVSYMFLNPRSNNRIWILLSMWSCCFAGEFLKHFEMVIIIYHKLEYLNVFCRSLLRFDRATCKTGRETSIVYWFMYNNYSKIIVYFQTQK